MKRLGMAAALAALGLAFAGVGAHASGGTYNVVKCHPWHQEADEVERAGGNPSYVTIDDCNGSSSDPKLGIYDTGAAGNNAYSQWMYTAPPGTHMVVVCFDHRLRRDNHHRADVLTYPGFDILATGGDDAGGWVTQCADVNATQLIVRLACSQAGGCPAGPNAHAYVRNIAIALSDDSDPTVTQFGGDLLAGGWLRGSHILLADASDWGSGVYQLRGDVNGHSVGGSSIACGTGGLGWNFSANLVPCPLEAENLGLMLNSAEPPFVNGRNTIGISAIDYGGNSTSSAATVLVDNQRPSAAFVEIQDPDDPEVVRATVADQHSGIGAAQLLYRAVGAETWQPLETRLGTARATARVNSSVVPSGEYEFRAQVSDVAGNSYETTLREDGLPMRLVFPLRARVDLRAGIGAGGSTGQTVPYGTSSEVHGRLLDASGTPIARQQVIVVDHFANGALYPRAERRVTTDEQGRFSTPEPAGPTRSIQVEYAGTNRYLPEQEGVGKFAVKGSASFTTSSDVVEEGTPIVFSGRVRHHGARIPAGGKLIEIQYRLKSGRQRTLKEPFRSEPDGSYRLAYRFSKALTADALFRFRVKIRNEGNWPFKGSTSKWRKVIVRAD